FFILSTIPFAMLKAQKFMKVTPAGYNPIG
ncbi:hypothetical protein SAMN05443529_1661, partial [Desulfosporosinus hippei DSM 8344]